MTVHYAILMPKAPRLTLSHLPQDHYCTFFAQDLPEKAQGPHTHDFHEFFWVERGEGIHWINGRKLALLPRQLIFIRADDTHALAARAGTFRIVNFAFKREIWSEARKRFFREERAFFSLRSLAARTYLLNADQLAAIRMAAGALHAGARDRLQTETFLLAVMSRLRADSFHGETENTPEWIRECCLGLKDRRIFSRGMAGLTGIASRSPEHIAREFRRHLKLTPTEVINRARMAYAADQLATTDASILSIVLDCGLENLGHFYRLFHQHHGLTPLAYREQQRLGVIGA
jgi:AraC family cel operon transcriptional repressor